MSTVVLVAGTGRSGTSMLAGMLHKLGVHMGDEFASPDQTRYHKDFFGSFEERELFEFHRSMKPGANATEWIDEYIAKRSEGRDLWGVKDPVLVRSFPYFAERVDGDVRVIIARRNKLPTISSYMLAYHTKPSDAEAWYEEETRYLAESLEKYDGPVLYVDYDDLLENPEREAIRVVEYIFGGHRDFEVGVWQDAIDSIDVSKRRFDRNGKWLGGISEPMDDWGNIAIGVRVAKYPEYHFFTSWTKLLTGGVRNGDSVLMPAGWMPAHWASNALARDFLRTKKDSLLMIDDDMMFEQDDLEKLRTNARNQEFDIISGFCTHRRWPPKPVVMREIEQPGEPFSLYGRAYKYVTSEINDGDIVEVDAVGLAFTLIKRHVLEAMTEEYGPMFTSYFSYGPGFESDDIPFAQKARSMGFRIGVDTSVKIGHIGQAIFGWPDYKQWMREHHTPNVVEFDAGDLIPILEEAVPLLSEHREAAENALKWIGG